MNVAHWAKNLVFLIFLLFSGTMSWGQIQACPGDTVVIRIKGNHYGPTGWQRSIQLPVWESAPGKWTNDSLTFTAKSSSSGFYRAYFVDGICDTLFSDTLTLEASGPPKAPVSKSASGIGTDAFMAHWEPTGSSGATTYYLDVATDSSFTNMLLGYSNKNVGNVSSSPVTGLSCFSQYYYRLRAKVDSCGISFNSNYIGVSTDTCPTPTECLVKSTCNGDIIDTRDNKRYKTVQIGEQCWMKENLNVGKRIDGILIQTQADPAIEKYCFNNEESNCSIYGGLYLWDEMMAYGSSVTTDPGPRGICPVGWHLPTDNEWVCLEKTLGGNSVAGGKLKDTILWKTPNVGGTNQSGFSALPGDYRAFDGTFYTLGNQTFIWTATESDPTFAWYRYLDFSFREVKPHTIGKSYNGFSVRCVKDN